MGSSNEHAAYKIPVRRLFWLPLGLSAALLLTVLSGLVVVSWRNLERIRPVQMHLTHIGQIQDVGISMEQLLLRGMRGASIDTRDLDKLRSQVRDITTLQGHLHPDSQSRLELVLRRLQLAESDPREILMETLGQLRKVLKGERAHHDLLLTEIASDSATEFRLALVLLVVLPMVGGAAMLLLRVRVKHPLEDLGDLLSRLAARDYRPVANMALDGTAGLVQPVFRSYNELVTRLQELEAEHRQREHTLERDVRQATEALLAQSRELARAERLAAVGAVSAGLAHELRNPLAGILMACNKLYRNLGEGEQASRVAAVILELKRINGLLTEKVDAARHAPEPLQSLRLSSVVDKFISLMRYQMPEGVRLKVQIPRDLVCLLPGAGLQQALLNLVLNAVQVLGDQGQVEVSAQRQAGELVLQVSDDGPGFPQEMLRAGVRPFATGRAGGTGLGLAMVRRFTRDHGGELELENLEPRGARVTLRLPCGQTGVDVGGDEVYA